MTSTIIIIIAVVVVLAVIIIAVAAKKKKKRKESAAPVAPMAAPSEETLKLVSEAYEEAKEQKQARIDSLGERAGMPEPVSDEDLMDMLGDPDPSLFEEMTSSGDDSGLRDFSDDDIGVSGTLDTLVSIENFEEQELECGEIPSEVLAYLNNSYYLEGETWAKDKISPMIVAIDGGDLLTGVEISGKQVEIMILDGKLYLINRQKETICKMSSMMLKMMNMDINSLGLEKIMVPKEVSSATPHVFAASVDGEDAVCYEYKNNESVLRLYASGDELRVISRAAQDGAANSVMKLKLFTGKNVREKFSQDGLNSRDMLSFFKDLM